MPCISAARFDKMVAGDIMAKKMLESMSKEELVEKLRKMNNSGSENKFRANVVLTSEEGEKLKRFLPLYNCENVSQLVKKIVNKKIILIFPESKEDKNEHEK